MYFLFKDIYLIIHSFKIFKLQATLKIHQND